jgi:hypothetical protein
MANMEVTGRKVGAIAASAAAIAFGAYAAVELVEPAGLALAAWLMLRRLAPAGKQPLAPCLGWLAGQLGAAVIALIVNAPSLRLTSLAAVALLFGLMVWLYLRLSRIAAALLLALQALLALNNAWLFLQAPITATVDKALEANLVWNITAIVLLIRWRRDSQPTDPARQPGP